MEIFNEIWPLARNQSSEFKRILDGCFWGLLRKKSLGEILFKMLLRKKYNHHSGRQQIKSLTKILTENALEYLASGKGFYGDRLTARIFGVAKTE